MLDLGIYTVDILLCKVLFLLFLRNFDIKVGLGKDFLGLYIAKKLMQKMGGEIFASCENGEMRITTVLHRSGN